MEGAALCTLTRDGRPLLLAPSPDEVGAPPYAGLVLAPWPNRIADGRYTFDGRTHQLPVNEVDRGTALHGLVLWERWEPVVVTGRSCRLRCEPVPRPGYPFRLRVEVAYTLDEEGLTVELEATNLGDRVAPVGLATHPYFVTGSSDLLDTWTLRLPCTQVVEVDDRLLPLGVGPASGSGLDFTAGRPLGTAVIDHAFTGVQLVGGTASCELLGPDGHGVRLRWDDRAPWVQVYTMHAPDRPWHRRAVAVEPMTCAPDAFNSGAGLIVLEPGATTGVGWQASAT